MLRPREWALLAALAAAFTPALLGMVGVWTSVDYYTHGFLVPVVALWVALRDRYRWPTDEGSVDGRGLLLLGGALAAYGVGLGLGSLFVQGLSFVAALGGALWWSRGKTWLAALAFPLCFLVFMVPLPPAWTTPAIVELQLFVSSAAIQALHWFAVPIMREGNVLVLPGGAFLFVAEACSGVTSIITLMPLGVVLAWTTLRSWTARTVLVSLVVPFAMLGNLVRVVGTVTAARSIGVERATAGPVHEMAGLGIYVVACMLLVGADALLRRAEAKR